MGLIQRQDIKNKTNNYHDEAWPDFWCGASVLINNWHDEIDAWRCWHVFPLTMRVFMVIAAAVRLK
jgi:hypothetical protein